MTDAEQVDAPSLLDRLIDALEEGALDEARTIIAALHPAEIADLLESLPVADRDTVWELIDPDLYSEVLAEVEDSVRTPRMLRMAPATLAAIASTVDDDDAADLLQDLPEDVIDEVLRAMDAQERVRIESILAYDEDTAGGLMNVDVVTIRKDVTIEVVQRYLRRRGEIPEKTNRLYVVDRENRFEGEMRLADVITADPETEVNELLRTETPAIPADLEANEVARLFEQRNLISAPVVDEAGRLIGRITIDDVVDVIRGEAEHSIMSMAGLDEEDDMFAPVLVTSRRRTVWLGVNLATALLASWVIGLFEATIEKVVALAVLMPVVASMGGIAGSQTLTVFIRAMALGQIGSGNVGPLLNKEVLVGLLNSAIWAVVVGLVAHWWFGDPVIGVVVAIALVVNLVVAAFSGALLPIAMRRFGVDPALAGGVVLTTVTDVVGFTTFLGLGTLLLLS
ncbi:MAG: magnesium transporter [Ectothiorhodospiraceae bacterium]|nr:magnesium transporter [Chromatiales bacterium]MCP5157304.1 magnesium transporter [Ectothiorhodospiraceae bacterium]